ncbi:MAG: hypothetical protein HY657_01610 [Acidobacteria bacterium]|nr:hypothetical protein [Acidobacteriota bacterium]
MQRLSPSVAELRFRRFSHTEYARREVPETPVYDRLANTSPRWRDLIGYYTRDDWHRYHTRHVTPRVFLEGLRAR